MYYLLVVVSGANNPYAHPPPLDSAHTLPSTLIRQGRLCGPGCPSTSINHRSCIEPSTAPRKENARREKENLETLKWVLCHNKIGATARLADFFRDEKSSGHFFCGNGIYKYVKIPKTFRLIQTYLM
jgi:hypothetical protein